MTNIAMSSEEIRELTTAAAVNVCQTEDSAFGVVISVPQSQEEGYDTVGTAFDLADVFCKRIHSSPTPIKLEESNGTNNVTYVFGEAIRLVGDPEYYNEFQRLSAYEASIILGVALVEK